MDTHFANKMKFWDSVSAPMGAVQAEALQHALTHRGRMSIKTDSVGGRSDGVEQQQKWEIEVIREERQ